MKRLIALIALAALPPGLASAQPPECVRDGAQSQMNVCAGEDAEASERRLLETYAAVRERHADQPLFLQKLEVAQRLWLAFRDAELEARFPVGPDQNERVLYGSMYPMCLLGLKEQMNNARTAHLRTWLDGTEPGDGCSGSAPMQQDS